MGGGGGVTAIRKAVYMTPARVMVIFVNPYPFIGLLPTPLLLWSVQHPMSLERFLEPLRYMRKQIARQCESLL